MEQLIPANDNTVTQGFFTFSTPKEVISDSDRLSLLQTLLTTTSVQSLLDSFRREISQWLIIDAVGLSSDDLEVQSGRDSAAHCRVDFPCHNIGDDHAVLRYSSAERLSVWQRSLLGILHDILQLPLSKLLRQEQLQRLATRDHLTGLGNRGHYEDSIETFMHRAERDGKAFGLLVLDLDKFKQINDAHGHCEGDTVLMAVASAIKVSLRGTDQAFRLGGDEFCCLIDDNKASTLKTVASRIRHNMQAQPVLRKHQLSCSIGFSRLKDDDTAISLFERADRGLYKEKYR